MVHDQAYKLAAARLKARKKTASEPTLGGFGAYATPGYTPPRPGPWQGGLVGPVSPQLMPNWRGEGVGPVPAALATVAQPAAPAPPASPPASPNGDISTPQEVVDPRDSTFNLGLAALLGQVQTQRNAVTSAGELDRQGFSENLGRIATQRSGSLKDAAQASNRQGLFYSGILGKRQGDVNAAYDDQVRSQATALAGREGQREAQLQQIGNITADPNGPYGYTAVGDAGTRFYDLLRSAADRRVAASSSEPVAAEPAPAPTPSATGTMAPPASAPTSGPVKPNIGAAPKKVASGRTGRGGKSMPVRYFKGGSVRVPKGLI